MQILMEETLMRGLGLVSDINVGEVKDFKPF